MNIQQFLTPKEVKVIHMALEVFIEDNTAMRTDQSIPLRPKENTGNVRVCRYVG